MKQLIHLQATDTGALLAVLLVATGCDAAPPATAPAAPQPQSLPTIALPINGTPLTIQVADDPDEREIGLMYTKSMPADRGMIFVFPTERLLNFWMRNTPVDLDIIYADHDGRVTAVKTMRAFDLSDVSSEQPATYAIELNAGVATKLKVTVGQKIALPASLTASVR
ncbi:MAG: hypothetical protein JWM57_1846 [Phycisphaerales bacterium]|nr:hypothetical protein [Phycisphaerales bacterium]